MLQKVKSVFTRKKVVHSLLTFVRIVAVVLATKYAINLLELHGFFMKFGKTGEFVCGALFDHLMFGGSE